jgi:hypothetical protein
MREPRLARLSPDSGRSVEMATEGADFDASSAQEVG